MSYRQIKWLIIIVPMLTIELWEFIRHEYLYPYLSMEAGNYLSAFVVLAVTLLLTMRLFARMEAMQEELNRERADKAILLERERIARQLHDGIAQSLFLLSVKMHKMEGENPALKNESFQGLKETIRRVHDDVRQSISNLRYPPSSVASSAWSETVKGLIAEFEKETGVKVSSRWELEEKALSPKDKVEIFACLREALMNIRKHAQAQHASIRLVPERKGWCLTVEDDGRGFDGDPFRHPDRFGLRMMRERAEEMGWQFEIERSGGLTRITIRKENQQ